MRLVEEVEKNEPKGIHLLVNNAGIARDDNTKYSNGKPDFKVSAHFILQQTKSRITPGNLFFNLGSIHKVC